MQHLIYFLALMPYGIFGLLSVPNGVLSFTCQTATGRLLKIPIADTKVSVQSSCTIVRSGGKKITEFPKTFIPGYNQVMSTPSRSGKYYISPINPVMYPNVFAVTTDGCNLAAVMVAKSPRGLPGSTPQGVVARPANSVRTRPGSPVPQSVRTVRPVVGRSESSTGKIEKRAVRGSDLVPCSAKTYDWDKDVSGTGREVGNIPAPGSRAPF